MTSSGLRKADLPEKMLGAWLEGGRVRLRRDLTIPEPAPGEALIRVRQAGICQTDLELIQGYFDFTGVIGHEFVGEVVVSPDDRDLEGDRVVGEINASCGACRRCRSGLARHCSSRDVLGILKRDGAFAEYVTLPTENLHRVPDVVSDEEAVFVEPLAASLEVLEQHAVSPSDRVLLIGVGRLGQLLARVLNASGCDLSVIAKYPHQIDLLAPLEVRAVEKIESEQGHFDVVVEATGSSDGFEQALRFVRPCGTIVLKSTYSGRASLDLTPLVVNEVRVIGSRCGPFEPALRSLQLGRIDPRPLITQRFPLTELETALAAAESPRSMKILLEVGADGV